MGARWPAYLAAISSVFLVYSLIGNSCKARTVPPAGGPSVRPASAILVSVLFLPQITPMLLQQRCDPFDDPDWIFELKYDGFRALAYVNDGECRLVSRNGHPFASFTELAAAAGEGFVMCATL